MNSSEVQWLKELFEQHKEDQKDYQDAKFSSVEDKIAEVKETVESIVSLRDEDIRDCANCRLCMERKITDVDAESKRRDNETERKLLVGGVLSFVAISLLAYGVYGNELASFIGQLIRGLF